MPPWEGRQVSAERISDYDGTDSVAYFRQIFNGWYIGIITPRSQYYAQVTQMGVMLALVGLVLACALSALLVRSHAAKMRADEESRSKSSFLARMSHEMRTPMNAIIGMTKLTRETDDPEKIQHGLENIQNAADHLLGVINDVLDMSKIEAGKLELSPQPFVLAHMVEKVTSVMQSRFDEKDQQFTVSLADEVPRVLVADEQRLAQVLTNLLSNAGKFTPEGGRVALRIVPEKQDADNVTLRVQVQDNGIGLSEEQQARLFQSFEQADNSISRKYGGTGLGLSISKRIVTLMGGDIWVVSQPGKGATFTFTMQAGVGHDAAALQDDGAPENYTGRFAGKRVLLAEDVEINQEILLAMLEDTAVQMDCVANGQEACDAFAAKSGEYDLIFMDIHMPEMDGYQAAKTIRACGVPGAKTVPIVAMTANVFKEDVERALAAGMNAHVGKPIDIDEVLRIMGRYLL